MREIAHGVVWFPSQEDQTRILSLMVDYCSCLRSAYQSIHKHNLKGNDIRVRCKETYSHLGQRYINDAVSEASKINQDNAIFGGKKLWRDLQDKVISKSEWQQRRNNQLYSRGDRSKKGNPNIRVVEDEIWINDPTQRGRWIKAKLWLHKPINPSCYDSRLIYNLDKQQFEVQIGWESEPHPVVTTKTQGVIGIDLNPDGIALVETDQHGNLLHHHYLFAEKSRFARQGKRQFEIRHLAIEVVDLCLKTGKSLVIEDLNFKKKKGMGRRFNRMSHNFLHRQMVEAIKSRAYRFGVDVVEVNPAFTSMIGILKYEKMYSLNRHTSAALVIARKGMGIREKVKVLVRSFGEGKKERLNLEGRGRSISLSRKAYTWMCQLYDISESQSEVTPPVLEPFEGIGTKPTVVVGDNRVDNWSDTSSQQLTLFDLWDMKESHQDSLES